MLPEIIGQFIIDFVVYGFLKIIQFVGAVVFSLFSLFKKTPFDYYNTDNFDKKVGQFWTGLLLIGLIVFGVWYLF